MDNRGPPDRPPDPVGRTPSGAVERRRGGTVFCHRRPSQEEVVAPNAEVVVSVTRRALRVDHPASALVSAAIHAPTRRRKRPSVLLVPGAGGDLEGAGLTALAEVLASLGCTVVRANLPYREAGRRAPRAERSVPGYLAVLAAARDAVGDPRPWILGGRSYGGRVASMAVAGGADAQGLLFYSYPLHPPGRPDRLRVEHWPQVAVPAMFLQGDRDPFCDLELLETYVHKFPRRATVHVVPGGDHALRVTRKASPTGTASSEEATVLELAHPLRRWLDALET